MLTSTEPDGHATSYGYDSAGDQVSVTDPLGNKTTATYDADGRLLTRTLPNGNVGGGTPANYTTTYVHDGDGELTKLTDPLGDSTSYTYDGDGNRVSETNADGQTTTFAYDADNEKTQTTRPDGSTTKTSYDGAGDVLTQTDGNGHVTTYAYDPLNRTASVTDANGHATTYTHDGAGNVLTAVDPSGRTTSYSYDVDNRLTGVSYSDGTTPKVTETYDADGRRTSMTDGTGTTTYTYDSLGRLTKQTNGAGATTSYVYDPAGLVTSLTYPNGKAVTRAYDADHRLISVTDWLGNTSSFGYDADGNLTSGHMPGAVTTSRTYDRADRLTGISDTNGSGTLANFGYTRDQLGQITADSVSGSVTESNGYSYDGDDRLTSENGTALGYDAANNPTTYVHSQPQTFDPANELLTSGTSTPPAVKVDATVSARKTQLGGTVTATGLSTTSAGDLVVAFVSLPNDLLLLLHRGGIQLSGAGLQWTLVQQAATLEGVGAIFEATAPTQLKGAAITANLPDAFDPALMTVTAFKPGAQVGTHSASGGFGAPALTFSSPAGAEVWGVGHNLLPLPVRPLSGNAVAQELSLLFGGESWVQHVFSPAAGKVTVGDSSPWTLSPAFAAVVIQPNPAAATPQRTFTYDAEGERIGVKASASATAYGYDQAGRLVSVSGGISYAYDGDGLRTSKTVGTTTTQFAWDETTGVPLLLQDGTTDNIYGPNGEPIEQISGTTPTFLLDDQQGSTRLLVNNAGVVVGTFSYDAWGDVTSHTGTTTTDLQYDGQYVDAETGFQYLRGRYYDPTTGQFLTVDPEDGEHSHSTGTLRIARSTTVIPTVQTPSPTPLATWLARQAISRGMWSGRPRSW